MEVVELAGAPALAMGSCSQARTPGARLPRTLDEALAAFEADAVLRGCLGEEFVKLFPGGEAP